MTSRPARMPRAVAVAALALVLPLAACAGTDSSADEPPATGSSSSAAGNSSATQDPAEDGPPAAAAGQRLEVRVAGGQVSGDTGRVPVAVGEQVTLEITSDVEDGAHVHGYDLTAPLTPGIPAEITFDATIPGVFEVELHDSGTTLLTLQVS